MNAIWAFPVGRFVQAQDGKRLRFCSRRSIAERPTESRAIGKRFPDISSSPNTAQHRSKLIVCFPTLGSGFGGRHVCPSTDHGRSLDERVALVTGGSARIGAEICRQLANSGAVVAVHCHRNLAAAEDLIEEIEDSGGEAFIVRGDLSEEDDRSALIEAVIEQAGRLDILVNNASIFESMSLDEMSTDAARMMWKINAEAPLMLIIMQPLICDLVAKINPGPSSI